LGSRGPDDGRQQAEREKRAEPPSLFLSFLCLSLFASLLLSLSPPLSLSLSLFIISLQQQRKAVGGLGPRFARSNVATGPAPGF
jgi:hypothetical protein